MRLPWPLPALLTWMLAWGLLLLLQRTPLAGGWALLLATVAGAACALAGHSGWRRLWMAAGFPLSVAAVLLAGGGGAGGISPWWWLLMAACVLLVYPLGAWKDAPLFPTPSDALDALGRAAPLPPEHADGRAPQVLDAGCGLGDGLIALQRAYPHADLHGTENSRLLALLARWRLSRRGLRASLRVGDLWAQPWGQFDVVYLFQRPETMPRAAAKAGGELARGAYLVSLEFAVPDEDAQAAGLRLLSSTGGAGAEKSASDGATARLLLVYQKGA